MDRARALTIAGIIVGVAALLGLITIFIGGGDPIELPQERASMPTAPSQSPVRRPLDAREPTGVAPSATTRGHDEPGAQALPEMASDDATVPAPSSPAAGKPAFTPQPAPGSPVDLQTPGGAELAAGAAPIVFCFPDVIPTPDACADRDTILAFATEDIGIAAPGGGAEALTVFLADPDGGQSRTASNCEQYLSLKANDWGALTTAGMRRERKMNRFCGLIAMARVAVPGIGGLTSLSEDLIEAMAEDDWPTIGEATVSNPLVLDTPGDPRIWFVQADRVEFTIRDVASADFDGDGKNEVLVFIALQAADGTAIGGGYSLAQRDGLSLTLKAARLY